MCTDIETKSKSRRNKNNNNKKKTINVLRVRWNFVVGALQFVSREPRAGRVSPNSKTKKKSKRIETKSEKKWKKPREKKSSHTSFGTVVRFSRFTSAP